MSDRPKIGSRAVRSYERYVSKGKELTKQEAAKYPILAVGEGLANEDVVHALESEEDLVRLAGATRHGDAVSRMLGEMYLLRKERDHDHGRTQRRQQKLVRRVQEDLKELESDTGFEMTSLEFHDAAAAPAILTPAIFRSGLLWDDLGGHGSWIPTFGVPYPDLNWFGWGNRAASVTVNGVMVICDGTWYGGPSAWFFGLCWPTFDLNWFQHRVESVYGT